MAHHISKSEREFAAGVFVFLGLVFLELCATAIMDDSDFAETTTDNLLSIVDIPAEQNN